MRNKKAFNTRKNQILKKIMPIIVLAEEPQGTDPATVTPEPQQAEPAPQGQAPTVNFEDLIANARKQEKDKLYPQIKKLEEEKKVLTEKNNNYLLTIGEKDAKISELETKISDLTNNASKGASEKEKSLTSEIEKLKTQIKTMEETTISREDVEKEIRDEYEVKLYREQKLREVGDTVIPELIMGSTKEEIDASVKISQERYSQITERVLGGVQVPVANVNTSSFGTKDLKIEDIANLDPRSPEYAQLRTQLGLK